MQRRTPRSLWIVTLAGLAASLVLPAPPALAHETDQYTLPLDKPFADVACLLDASHTQVLERAVDKANAEIAAALREKRSPSIEKRLERLWSQDYLVQAVYAQFSDAANDIRTVESALSGAWAREAFPDAYAKHRTINWVYTYSHFWLDPRRLITLWRSATIKSHGVYFGTDKLAHFHHMGRFYYTAWRDNLAAGMTEEEAVANMIARYSDGGPLGENGLLGFVATGVYSNADLVANYTGYKFYRNITEPVTLKGEEHPPLCVRVGNFWRLNTHVRPESGWFGAYISDHWNEAFNPNVYDPTIRGSVRKIVRRRADNIYSFWTQRDNRPSDPAYYDDLAMELTTYYGEQYGHSDGGKQLLTLGNTVIPAVQSRASAGSMGRR